MQLFPTKLLGVVADHGEFPIERIAVDMGGEGHWVGSVGHDEVLRLTDLREVLEDEAEGEELEVEDESDSDSDSEQGVKPSSEAEEEEEIPKISFPVKKILTERSQDVDERSSNEEEEADSDNDRPAKKRKTKQKVEDPLATDKKRNRKPRKDEVVADPTFFADL